MQVNGDITGDTTNGVGFIGTGSFGTISYNGNANLNNTVTASNSVAVCKQPSATQSGNANWGTSGVYSQCAGCSGMALPVELVSFNGECSDQGYDFNWLTASELNNLRFDVEVSKDAANWTIVASQADAIHSQQAIQYQTTLRIYYFQFLI